MATDVHKRSDVAVPPEEYPKPKRDLASTLTPGMRAIILMTIMAATLMEVLDTSIVNVALPDMMGNLGTTLDQIGWVSTGYIISNVIVLPLTGWLSDWFGRKRYLTYSIILFTIASFGCGISHSLAQLVVWRILQGAGGAAFISTAQATLIEIFPPKRRGFAQAMFGIGVIAAPTLGPTLGGFITDRFSWPWIFFVNVPIGILVTILVFAFVPDSPSAGARRSADFIGIGLLAIGLGCLQTVLERGEAEDWFSTNYIVVLAIIAVVGMAIFIWWELRDKNLNPAVNLRTLTNRNLAAGCACGFSLGFVLYGFVFIVPQFLQTVQSHTAEQAGLLLMPGGLASAAMMPIVGKLINKVDSRLIIGAGMAIFTVSMVQFSGVLTLNTNDQTLYWPLVLRGAGIGLQFVPLSLVALGTLKPNQVAQGAGLYNLFRQLGGSFGIAILATLIDRRQRFHAARLSDNLTSYSYGTQQRLTQLQSAFAAKGMTADTAKDAANKALYGTIHTQSTVLSYMDVFYFLSFVSLGAILLLFLFKRTKAKGSAAAAAH